MGRIEDLADKYERHIAAPWQRNLAGAQKAIFVVYDKTDERKLRAKRREFEMRTRDAGHKWREVDLTDSFPRWMAQDEYRDAYFESPDDLTLKLQNEYVEYVASRLREALLADDVAEDTVVGVFGAASLYGFSRISEVLKHIEGDIRGRLVLFFPGDHDQNNYRLLDARDGWNYLAVPITLNDGENR
jgi:hypothetical protein